MAPLQPTDALRTRGQLSTNDSAGGLVERCDDSHWPREQVSGQRMASLSRVTDLEACGVLTRRMLNVILSEKCNSHQESYHFHCVTTPMRIVSKSEQRMASVSPAKSP